MVMPNVTIRGLPELKRDLERLGTAITGKLAKNASMAGARVIVRHAKLNAPVETGALRASIRARRSPDSRFGDTTSYANATVFYSRFLELGTAHQVARPFMRPAADEHGEEVRQKMIANLSNGIDRELAKLPVIEDVGDL